MTICASVKVRDGLVLATDSMTQIQVKDATGRIGVAKTYGNARKLFRVRGLPIGVMSYGLGNIGERSIQGLVDDFSKKCSDTDVQAVTVSLFQYMKSLYDGEYAALPPNDRPALGFFVAGYSEAKAFAEEWEFLLPRDESPRSARQERGFGASWRGITIPFSRLHKGVDPRLWQRLLDSGIEADKVNNLLAGIEASVVFNAMPVQDAINFAAFILRVTIGMSNFEAAPPSCGGPLQVAVILPGDGFQWVEEPKLTLQAP